MKMAPRRDQSRGLESRLQALVCWLNPTCLEIVWIPIGGNPVKSLTFMLGILRNRNLKGKVEDGLNTEKIL